MPGARKRNWQVMNEMPSSSASPSAPKLSPAALNAFFNRPDSIESWRGKTLRTIHGITKAPGELHFLCKFNDESMHLVPASEANERFPDRVIRFYESRLALEDVDIQ
uniref:ChSh domain-containing protein n=1 Tax=Caenorhabditis japonica TaxID=281687 RepID=A0A8R1DY32_CAEJA